MNRIVLIGNGFDLAHGLPTRYEDFINDYWEGFMNHCIYQDIVDASGRYKYDCIELNIPQELTLSDFLPVGDYPYKQPNKKPISYNELMQEIDEYNKNVQSSYHRIRLNIINKFLRHLIVKCDKEMGWVDIENEYYRFLSYYLNSKEHDGYQYGTIDILNRDFGNIKNKLENYLNKILTESNLSPSKNIRKILYASFSIKDFVAKARRKIVLEETAKIDQYLDTNIDPDYHQISKKTIPWVDEIKVEYQAGDFDLMYYLQDDKFAAKHFDLSPKNVLLLNFNYTNIEKLYIKHKNFKPEVIHIHGELKNNNNSMIFGYGDELEENYSALENLKDNAYLYNIKSMQYLESDNYRKLLSYIESDEYQIIILGHSCGNSDRTLLNTLFEHKNCVSIKPYYYRYKDKETGEIKDNYSDIVRNISRNFKDKKSMRDKVVNKTYTTWFSEG